MDPVRGTSTVAITVVDLMADTEAGAAAAQFRRLIEAGSQRSGIPVTITTVGGPSPRGPAMDWRTIAESDAVVVTGTQPTACDIAVEPTTTFVSELLSRRSRRTVSVVFSCLAAHSALFALHSIERTNLPAKVSGLVRHRPAGPTCAGRVVTFPHSRWNDVRAAELHRRGLPVVLAAGDDEWGVATSSDGLEHVFLQCHPEYSGGTLAREYQRDLRRFENGLTPTRPSPPEGYSPAARSSSAVESTSRSGETLLGATTLIADDDWICESSWRSAATSFTATWLEQIAARRTVTS